MRALAIQPAAERAGDAVDSVSLDFDDRHRRRFLLTTESGREVLLDLAEVPSLAEGDGLVLENGDIIEVRCAEEALLEVSAADARTLARLAWHLGNRHLPTEVGAGVLRLREDHVIEDMLARLGAQTRHVRRPFHPEGGAYGHGRTHAHDHVPPPGSPGTPGHEHGHAHGHAHEHAHEHDKGPSHAGSGAPGEAHGHRHGDGRSHAHSHEPGHGH